MSFLTRRKEGGGENKAFCLGEDKGQALVLP